jgi:hypothetical protein
MPFSTSFSFPVSSPCLSCIFRNLHPALNCTVLYSTSISYGLGYFSNMTSIQPPLSYPCFWQRTPNARCTLGHLFNKKMAFSFFLPLPTAPGSIPFPASTVSLPIPVPRPQALTCRYLYTQSTPYRYFQPRYVMLSDATRPSWNWCTDRTFSRIVSGVEYLSIQSNSLHFGIFPITRCDAATNPLSKFFPMQLMFKKIEQKNKDVIFYL